MPEDVEPADTAENRSVGPVLALAVCAEKRAPLHEVTQAAATAGGGLEGDHPRSPGRGITLIAKAQWEAAIGMLGVDLPWYTRRANVLVDTSSLADLIGKTVRIGEVEVAVNAETLPCQRMDEIQPGLREALAPECRGGVTGQITRGGTIHVGDKITLF